MVPAVLGKKRPSMKGRCLLTAVVAKCLIFGSSALDGGYQQGCEAQLVLGMKAGGSAALDGWPECWLPKSFSWRRRAKALIAAGTRGCVCVCVHEVMQMT